MSHPTQRTHIQLEHQLWSEGVVDIHVSPIFEFLKTKSVSKKSPSLVIVYAWTHPTRQGRKKSSLMNLGNLCWNQQGEKIWSLLIGLGRLPTQERLYLGAYWESLWTRGTSRNLRAVAEERKSKTKGLTVSLGSRIEEIQTIDSAKSSLCCSGQVQERW